jgi:hypothetical protein
MRSTPQYAARRRSNSLVRGPVVIQPLRKASSTALMVRSSMRGGLLK